MLKKQIVIQISIFDRGIFWCAATLLNVASGAFETIEHRACIIVSGGGIFSRLSFGRGIMVVIGADGVIEQRVCILIYACIHDKTVRMGACRN